MCLINIVESHKLKAHKAIWGGCTEQKTLNFSYVKCSIISCQRMKFNLLVMEGLGIIRCSLIIIKGKQGDRSSLQHECMPFSAALSSPRVENLHAIAFLFAFIFILYCVVVFDLDPSECLKRLLMHHRFHYRVPLVTCNARNSIATATKGLPTGPLIPSHIMNLYTHVFHFCLYNKKSLDGNLLSP